LSRCAAIVAKNGAQIIQLRDKYSPKKTVLKEALQLKALLAKSNTVFIINDYPDIAKLVDSDGVHLGQDDLPIDFARKLLGKGKIIGVSCHNIKEAIAAQNKGADYIGIGPIFPTSTKPGYRAVGLDLIRQCQKNLKIPFFAIGGITAQNIKQVCSCKGQRVAVCRPICKSKDMKAALRRFMRILN
jgi:thiamine-phosphate pyrophosphorylase